MFSLMVVVKSNVGLWMLLVSFVVFGNLLTSNALDSAFVSISLTPCNDATNFSNYIDWDRQHSSAFTGQGSIQQNIVTFQLTLTNTADASRSLAIARSWQGWLFDLNRQHPHDTVETNGIWQCDHIDTCTATWILPRDLSTSQWYWLTIAAKTNRNQWLYCWEARQISL